MTTHEIFILLDYISVFVMVACFVTICTHSRSRMQQLAMLVCLSLTMCCLGFLFRAEAVDADSYIIGQKLIYAFVTHGMFLMLLFILEYCKFSIPKQIENVFHAINFIISFVVLTLDYHHLFYKSYWAVQSQGHIHLDKDYGFMHTVAIGLFALYMAAAVIITIIFTVKNIRKRSKYVWRILIAVMVPCLSYIIPKVIGLENDCQPMAFAIFAVIVVYMIYRNSLYDINNIAAQYSIDSMEESLIVIDSAYQFKGCNRQAYSLFPMLKRVELDADIRKESHLIADFFDGKLSEYRDGNKIYSIAVRPIIDKGITHGKVVKIEDITIQHQYTDLLEANVDTLTIYSYTDELTGIKNRRAFEEAVNDLRTNSTIDSLLIGSADINTLKNTNDILGHAAGDEIIKAGAEIMNSVFSDYGWVFRTGGDEFVIIMEPAPSNLDAITAEFDQAVSQWHGTYVDSLSISYGFVYGKDSKATTIDELLIEADRMMYESKRRYYQQEGIDRRQH